MSKNILITGISSGIGYDAARVLAARGYRVFGSVRRQADAERVRAELGENVTPLLFDVTDHEAITAEIASMAAWIGDDGLWALVNNAGISVPGPLAHMPLDDLRWQLEVNLVGLLDVTQQCLPLLGAAAVSHHPPGRIINISSVSGKIGYPFMGAYAASKHALEGLSDSLRRELMLYGIDVVLIEPGTVKTPIVGKFAEQIEKYLHTDYGRILQKVAQQAAGRENSALPVEKVTQVIVNAIEAKTPKTRYAIPRKRLMGWWLPRFLPDRLVDKMTARTLGIKADHDR